MKLNKKIIRTLIMLTLITNTIIFPANATTQQNTQPHSPPEITPERLRVNMTDTIPMNYAHTNIADSPQQLQFKNMVIELTTSRKMTMTLSSDEHVKLQYFSMNMELTQNMHINMNAAQNPPENIPEPIQGIHKYITIEPNTTEPVKATLKLYMDPEELETETIEPEQYSWCYWNDTHWEITPTRYTSDGFLEANTTHFSVWTIKQQPGKDREIAAPDAPGIHMETKAYNYTDTDPNEFKYETKENEPIMLQFKNSAIYMHSTSPIELQYTAENQNRQRMLRVEVEAGESLRLEVKQRESKPEEVGEPGKSLGVYYEIEPNRTITQAKLGYEIDPVEVQSMGIDVEKLSWAYWNGPHWDLVESQLTEDNVLEADTDHFSVWTIMEVEEMIVPEEPVIEPEPIVEPEPELVVAPEEESTGIPGFSTVSVLIGLVACVFWFITKRN